jgi:zinc/manganese transport system substrate-binding protein
VISYRRLIVCIVLLSFIYFTSCKPPVTENNTRLKVLTTVAPIFSFTKNITGNTADVENLLPSGAGPHEYSLSPDDARKIAQADIIIINGVNLESWLNKLTGVSENSSVSTVVDSSSGIEILDNDPHIWLSPLNAIMQVKRIRDGLINADPENRKVYSDNSAAYIKRLEILDKEISDEISGWDRKDFVAFHPAFRYLAKDYGLNLAAVIKASPEAEPSPRHIAKVIDIIKSKNIKSIFTDPMITHKIVRSIATDLDLQVYSLDTMETGNSSKEYYEDRTRANISVLKKALY